MTTIADTEASTHERICKAALEGFAANGVEATSIRDVAAAAGVSPGLVQHYFPSKLALRDAVDRGVTQVAEAALAVREVEGDVVIDIADRLTSLVVDHFVSLKYVARGVAERDEAALRVFDTLTSLCRAQLDDFKQRGLLREDLDLEWAALHTVLINLATVILEPGVTRRLGRPLLSKAQIDRWRDATTALFVGGELHAREKPTTRARRVTRARTGAGRRQAQRDA
jgi:AcrR family transcriptional regulator